MEVCVIVLLLANQLLILLNLLVSTGMFLFLEGGAMCAITENDMGVMKVMRRLVKGNDWY